MVKLGRGRSLCSTQYIYQNRTHRITKLYSCHRNDRFEIRLL